METVDRRRSAVDFFAAGILSMVLATAGCSSFRWSGYRSQQLKPGDNVSDKHDEFSVNTSTRPARRRPQDFLPKNLTKEQMETGYYSDLGPDTIDVSSYPARQKHNYAVYSHACSQCHALARSINAPMVNRRFWEFYILGMRFNAYFEPGTRMSKEEIKAILDFVEFDSNFRKVLHRSEFDELTAELKRRFTPILEERLRKLQGPDQPIILRSEQHHP